MALDPVLPISGDAANPVAVSAQQWRRLDVGTTMAHDLHDVAARAGVCAGLSATVVGTSVTVSAGSAIITPTVGANGSYRVSVASAESLPLTARDATYTRHDLVVLRVYDADTDASGQWLAKVEVVTGTPSASPAAPPTPSGTLALWTVVVPPTGTITAVDIRTWTSALGGVITGRSSEIPSGPSLRAGQVFYESNTGRLYVWSGTAWKRYLATDEYVSPTWVDLAILPGWGSSSVEYNPRYAIVGDMVSLRMMVRWDSGSINDPIVSLPTAIRPNRNIALATSWMRPSSAFVNPFVMVNGNVQVPSGYSSGTPTAGSQLAVQATWPRQ